MLLIVGSVLSGTFEKNSLMNYAGFGMLVSGAGVFVYGLFETAKFSAMGYLNYRHSRRLNRHSRTLQGKPASRLVRFRFFLRSLVRTSAILNLAGVIIAVCMFFFSLWQLDLIVSGPVWWSSSSGGSGYGWSHPTGAYSTDYFQCFFWKTTIGQAYDTLFMLIFISFIVMFASAYFWPKPEGKFMLKLHGSEATPKKRRAKRKKPKPQPQSPSQQT